MYAGYVLLAHRTHAAFGKEVLLNRISAMVYLLDAFILVLLTSLALQDSIYVHATPRRQTTILVGRAHHGLQVIEHDVYRSCTAGARQYCGRAVFGHTDRDADQFLGEQIRCPWLHHPPVTLTDPFDVSVHDPNVRRGLCILGRKLERHDLYLLRS